MNKNDKIKNRSVSAGTSSNGKAALFTLGFCYLFIIAEIAYKIKIAEEVCTWEIILLFLMLSVYGIFQKLFSGREIPCDLKGEPLPTGDTKPEKKKRSAFYRINSLIYSVIFAVILVVAFTSSSMVSNVNMGAELFFDTELPNFVFGIILAAIIFPFFYGICLLVEVVWYEYKISQQNLLTICEGKEEEEAEENQDRTKEATQTKQVQEKA